jgi:ABC-2 type transport system ATP-binding protein
MIHVSNLTKIFRSSLPGDNALQAVQRLIFPKYKETVAVKDVSFSISEGEFVGYVGPNGAGKTTTLKVLSGVIHPTSGDVRVMGHVPASRHPAFLNGIAFLMGQKSQLWWDIPAIETFRLNKAIYRIPQRVFEDRLDELGTLLRARELFDVPVRKLSLGQRMKMEIIASLLHGPKVLFLDEPTLGLDLFSQEAIREFFVEYNRVHKATIMLTSHYTHDLEVMAKRIIMIDHGSIIYDGDKAGILSEFSKERVLKLKFRTHIPPETAEMGTLTVENDKECQVKMPEKDLREALKQLSQNDDILEISIAEISLEYAIKKYLTRNSIS